MQTRRKVLIVDPDARASSALASSLERSLDISTRQASSVHGAMAALRDERFEAAIMDVELPDGDGRDLCGDMRAQGLTMPILMLTDLTHEMDVVRGLDAGANDYMMKPFRPHEIAARLRAQMRQHEVSEHAEIRIGDFVFRPGNKTIRHPGQTRPTRLTEKEAAVLKYLYRAAGRMVTREDLLADVWGYNAAAATHTVETHVYRLRRKVEPRAESPRILLHERGGYRLLRFDLAEPFEPPAASSMARLRAAPTPVGSAWAVAEPFR